MSHKLVSCSSSPVSSSLQIAVLSGGDSSERDVSLESGLCVLKALAERGHNVRNLDPSHCDLATVLTAEFDVVLPMLHGTGAEDGRLQQLLETLGIAWVGSSSAASALTFSKSATRDLLQRHGLPVAPGFTLSQPIDAQHVQAQADQLGWPLVVKPDAEGSSVGISMIDQAWQLPAALKAAGDRGDIILIERYIPGREITVPVIDGVVFPTIEIIPTSSWYDYAAKYTDDSTKYVVDPEGIEIAAQLGKTLLPPLVIGFGHFVPIVGREAPVLTLGSEVIRWRTGLAIHVVQLGSDPGIRTMAVDTNRNISFQYDTLATGVITSAFELLVEMKL